MKHVPGSLMILLAAVLATSPLAAQDIAIDKKQRHAIVDTVCTLMTQTYVFADVAERVDKSIRGKLKKGDYKSITSLSEFVDRLTEDMNAIADDGHLWVKIPPEEELQIARGEIEPPQGDDTQAAYNNYGFKKLEILDGNIGYLNLTGFYDVEGAAYTTATAAMNFLAHANAIIIDIRENGGGSPEMIQLISSYFFAESVHLNSFNVRETGEYRQFWTHRNVPGKKIPDAPIYILTSDYSFSAAEEFAYNLKHMERATVVGDTTGGGAHNNLINVYPDLNIAISMPFARAINPITNTNWEKVGVIPNVAVPSGEALDVAKLMALKQVAEKYESDERRHRMLTFVIDRLDAMTNPRTVDITDLEKWAGTYGQRRLFVEDGQLWYQRGDNPPMQPIAWSSTVFFFEDVDYFKLVVETNDEGEPVALVGNYKHGHTDRSERSSE